MTVTDGRETFTLLQYPAPAAEVSRGNAALARSVASRLAAAHLSLVAVFARAPSLRPPPGASMASRLHAADAAITAALGE